MSPSRCAEVEVRTVPQRAAAIDGCALKGGHTGQREKKFVTSVGMKKYL